MSEKFVDNLLAYLLQRASHLVTNEFHGVLKMHNISKSRWRLLVWLSDEKPSTIGELTESLMMEQPAVSKVVNDAEKEGLVQKRPDPEDGRRVRVAITAEGERIVAELKRRASHADHDLAARLGEDTVAQLKADLVSVIRRYGQEAE